ncbi:MAG: 3TM-type holin [Acidiferrobacteraceae bacterium]
MGILDILSAVFKPITDIVDHLTVSGDEKAKLQSALIQAQFATASQAMTYEQQLLDARTKIITAEAGSQSWIARNWRPITMLTFLVLVVCDSFGWLPFRLADQAWTLLKIGLGGYVVGRSVEKTSLNIGNVIKTFKAP